MRIGIDGRKIADFGIGTYIRGLLAALAEENSGEEFVVFAPASARAAIPSGFEHRIADSPNYSIRELLVIGSAIRSARLDVFHAPHYVVPITRCPVVVTIHDLIHLRQPLRNPFAPLYARVMIGRAVRKARRVITVSEAARREILGAFGCEESKVVVTPNGVSEAFRAPAPQPGGAYFLYVGNDKPHKNVDLIVDAIAEVRRRMPHLNLVLVGAPFERFRGSEGVDPRGFVAEDALRALYRGSIAVLQPSRQEGFGLPAVEAMASGTAVITSQADALVEITADAALHVAEERASWSEAMLRVANDDALRAELGARGIARAARFTWSECARLTLEVYREAARSHSSSRSTRA